MLEEIYKDQNAYFSWRVKKVKRIEKRFPQMFEVRGKNCLDIGCGSQAALSFALCEKGANVKGGDVDETIVGCAKKFAPRANLAVFEAENLPFRDGAFDFVFLLDVLEHVKDPEKAVKEAVRCTKKNGRLFIEFSPYWAQPSGHHLYPLGIPKGFLPFQFFPKSLTKYIVGRSKISSKDSPGFLFWQFDNLNRLSVQNFRRIAKKLQGVKILEERYCLALPNGEIELPFLKYFPVLNELFTMNYGMALQVEK